jgi:3-hydroxyisobutyrate dehydrogenase-like beta-hydroxyacid dehydrogenase
MATRVDEQPMPWAEKDMRIALTEADRLRVALPLNGTVKEVVKSIKLNRNEHFPYDGK